MKYPIRINKYIRDKGFASRREADKLIFDGLVTVNGKRAETGMLVNENDKVVLNKQYKKSYKYLAYYKPVGLATQAPEGSESVVAEWQKKGLFPVGRLDKESEGLIILTNDGRVTTKIIGAQSRFEKEYVVSVKEKLNKRVAAIFEKGMQTKTFGKLLPVKTRIINDHMVAVILQEGKRHQIRVMLSELGYTIVALKRVRIGNILIGNLRPGQTRDLTAAEIK